MDDQHGHSADEKAQVADLVSQQFRGRREGHGRRVGCGGMKAGDISPWVQKKIYSAGP